MTGCFLFSFIQCRKKEKKNLCSSAPFTIYQLGIKEIINLNSYKLIFAVCVYKVHPLGDFCFFLFFLTKVAV